MTSDGVRWCQSWPWERVYLIRVRVRVRVGLRLRSRIGLCRSGLNV